MTAINLIKAVKPCSVVSTPHRKLYDEDHQRRRVAFTNVTRALRALVAEYQSAVHDSWALAPSFCFELLTGSLPACSIPSQCVLQLLALKIMRGAKVGENIPWAQSSRPFSDTVTKLSEFDIHCQSHSDRQREIRSSDSEIGAFLKSCPLEGPRKSVLKASTLLSQWREFGPDGQDKMKTDIKNFQDILRKFPPRINKEGSMVELKDIVCGDCEAVFSSMLELDSHRLTKFCPGAAIVVHVMMRDNLINKGYRIEQRLVPLEGRPLRVPCSKCTDVFVDDEAKDAHESLHQSNDLICLQCDRRCDTAYELKQHYDYHENMEFRQLKKEMTSNHKRASSHPQMTPKTSIVVPLSPTENALRKLHKRKSQKILDAWPLRRPEHREDGEIVALSFSMAEDIERVHAADGALQEVDSTDIVDFPIAQFTTWLDMRDSDDKSQLSTMHEDKENIVDKNNTTFHESQGNTVPRRMSLLKSVLGLKFPKRLSRSDSVTSQPRKLMKKENSIRFSLVSKPKRSEEMSTRSESRASNNVNEARDGGLGFRVYSPEDIEGERSPFVHMRTVSEGVVVEDVSGRQRILPMEQIAYIYSVISADSSSIAIKSKIRVLQSQAEMTLQNGHLKTAIATYKDVLDILMRYQALDTDQRIKAGVLHRVGCIYSTLGAAGEAEYYFLKALAIYKKLYGRDHAVMYSVLNDIAKLCERDGYATEAAALYERVLAGRLRVLGQNAPETLSSMQELANIKISLGDLESALDLFEHVVPAFEVVFGLQNESTLNAMNHLAILYQKLGLNDQSLSMSRKMLPYCKTVVGFDSSLTRNALTRYLEDSDNFDFSADVKLIIDHYRRSRCTENHRVLQTLGRAYMNSGLNRDASDLFVFLFDETTSMKGADSLESFDALSGLCVTLEHLGHLDEAIKNYGNLLKLAHKTPLNHPSRSRMDYSRKRVTDLLHRREVLTAERRAWGLFEDGACLVCQNKTTSLCNTCHIVRFCSVDCHDKSIASHRLSCIPSVTLRESKSVAIAPRCPSPVQKDALDMILPSEKGAASPSITASHTVYLDPRNFTTFRMKLSSTVNTLLVFSPEADIRYTIIGNISECGTDQVALPTASVLTTGKKRMSSTTPAKLSSYNQQWLTPAMQESVSITPMEKSAPIYLVVAPGEQMMKNLIERRVRARSGDGEKEKFESLKIPNDELIEYAQGLLMNGYMGEAFLYIVGWV
ncbi:tetratricopeptide repeat protein [Talaromyces proteolyticus]|uniref:Tetratricopeptide repeat protein n=1 Tax=Talaromyces proteolyticus TaxID=1131652 RepID=A0AAD4PYY5_9EURO|nr:tetratricopeptide repeat protein [Talaromyces proteolyticus]KAH8695129.1 tetratricopeptide repeat protein [Talaromyces proteolyticus]